jgi:dolichol-phosphate mannosyltransferase
MQEVSRREASLGSAESLVIIPTFNESHNVVAVIERVMGLTPRFDVLVVDDNSPDGTADLVREVQGRFQDRVHLVVRAGKEGLGTAYIRGFRFALEQGYAMICEMDADLSHNPDDLPRLMHAIHEGADLAIGSRYIDGVRVVNWPLSRLILSYGASIYARVITGMPVHDVTSGFKVYRRRVLEAIDLGAIRSNGYSFQVEMKYRTWRLGFRMKEVPIIFTERVQGTSKMNKAIVHEAAWKVWELRLRDLFRRL